MSDEEPKSTTDEQRPINDGAPFTNWVIPEGGAPEIYSDWYYVNWLPLTARIRFGQIVADPRLAPGHADSSWVINERVAVTMPWHAVKALANMLTNLVAAYEKDNGELTIPKVPNL